MRQSRLSSSAGYSQDYQIFYFVQRDHEITISNGEKRQYILSWWERLFVTLEEPKSSITSALVGQALLLSILLNILIFIISTVPQYEDYPTTCASPACDDEYYCPGYQICQPTEMPVFTAINEATIIIFTVDYGIRLILCGFVPTRVSGVISEGWDEDENELAKLENRPAEPEPCYSWYYQFLLYLFSFYGIVDFLAIVPYYILIDDDSNSAFATVYRVFRLLRILKILRYFEGPLAVIRRTLWDSREVMFILAFCFGICIVVFGSIIYSTEQGVFRVDNFTAAAGFPQGAFVRTSIDDMGMDISPFDSVPTSIYWACVTITTVGYGDLYPVSRHGRIVACFAAVAGIFVIALPVSVLGNNFNREYEIYEKSLREENERRAKALEEKKAQAMELLNNPQTALADAASKMLTKMKSAKFPSMMISGRGTSDTSEWGVDSTTAPEDTSNRPSKEGAGGGSARGSAGRRGSKATASALKTPLIADAETREETRSSIHQIDEDDERKSEVEMAAPSTLASSITSTSLKPKRQPKIGGNYNSSAYYSPADAELAQKAAAVITSEAFSIDSCREASSEFVTGLRALCRVQAGLLAQQEEQGANLRRMQELAQQFYIESEKLLA